MKAAPAPFYADKLDLVRDIFGGKTIELGPDHLSIDGESYPIVDDVIIALEPGRYPAHVKKRLKEIEPGQPPGAGVFAPDIQRSFGAEWRPVRGDFA